MYKNVTWYVAIVTVAVVCKWIYLISNNQLCCHYCLVFLSQNPVYMKDGFMIKTESIHLPDRGETENVRHFQNFDIIICNQWYFTTPLGGGGKYPQLRYDTLPKSVLFLFLFNVFNANLRFVYVYNSPPQTFAYTPLPQFQIPRINPAYNWVPCMAYYHPFNTRGTTHNIGLLQFMQK